MLKIARNKARRDNLKIQFLQGNMRTTQVGTFDAVITIFNAIGHLTKTDFEKTIRNIHTNLKEGGFYIFDIFNLSYLLHGDQITRLTIDWQKMSGNIKGREIQYSTIDKAGILASYTTSYEQKGAYKPKILTSAQTLLVYSAKQLRTLLEKNGFQVLDQSGIDGSKLDESRTQRTLTVARKPL